MVDDNCVGPLYKHVFPPALAPWLSFIGLPWKVYLYSENDDPISLIDESSKYLCMIGARLFLFPCLNFRASG